MRFFDSHCHVSFDAYKTDADDVIKRALAEGVGMVTVGSQLTTSRQAVEMASRYSDGIYASIGLHPIHTVKQVVDEEESHFLTREEKFDETAYAKLLGPKVVAIGECGLDYYRMPEGDPEQMKQTQKQAFIAQLKFAKKHSLPLIIHCRDAYDDLLEVVRAEYDGPAIVHSFTADWEIGKKFLDLGYYLAFNAILMFDKTGKLEEVVKQAPLEKLLIETDAPYLAPAPYRGQRNEPAYVKYVAERVGLIKGKTTEAIGIVMTQNAKAIYGIKD